MKSEKLSTEIAALQRKQKETKNAVAKKALSSKIERLKKELDEITTSAQAKTALAKAQSKIREMSQKDFGEFVKKLAAKPEFSFLKGMSKSKIKDDIMRVAKPVGWRFRGRTNVKKPTKKDIQEGNNVYYEGRVNRSDVSRTVRLAEGGGVKYPTDLKVGTVLEGVGFPMLKGIDGGNYYTIVEMDNYSATLTKSDKNGNKKGSKKVRHYLSSIEGAIKTASRGDENGILVVKYAKGGKTDFGMLSVKAGIDNNPNPTYADKIAGATHKFAKGGGVGVPKKPKYKIGQLVYSYQNKDTKYPINYIKEADDLGIIRYRLSLPNGNSNWINEESIYGDKYANGGGVDMLHEDDFVWNALGKKLVVDKVTDDEYWLSGFMQPSASPFSKEKVHSYLKKGEWSLQPKMAEGGDVQSSEPHRLHMMAKGGMTFSESVLKEGLSDMLHHLYKAQNELDGIMGYLDRTGQGGMKSALKSKFGLNSISETTEKIDTYLDK